MRSIAGLHCFFWDASLGPISILLFIRSFFIKFKIDIVQKKKLTRYKIQN
jgi:hypothetical protein